MIVKIYFGGNFYNSHNILLTEHPLLTFIDIQREKAYLINLTSHVGKKVSVLKDKAGKPYTLKALRPSKAKTGKKEFLDMFITNECAVFELNDIQLPTQNNSLLEKNKVQLKTYTCFNLKDLIQNALKIIYKEAINMVSFNAKTSKILEGYEMGGLVDDVFNYIDRLL